MHPLNVLLSHIKRYAASPCVSHNAILVLKLLMDVDSDSIMDTQPQPQPQQQSQQQQQQQQRTFESTSPTMSPITPNSQSGDMYGFPGAVNGHTSNDFANNHFLVAAATSGSSLFLSESLDDMSGHAYHHQHNHVNASPLASDNRAFVRHTSQGSMDDGSGGFHSIYQQQVPHHPHHRHHHHHQHSLSSTNSYLQAGMSTPTDSAISLTSDMNWTTTASHSMVSPTPMPGINHHLSDTDDHDASFAVLAKAKLQESAIGLHDVTSSTPTTVVPSTLNSTSRPDISNGGLTSFSRVFWPKTFALYIEHMPATGGNSPHLLAKSADNLNHAQMASEAMHKLSAEKFPCLFNLYQRAMCPFLYMTVKMNLDLAAIDAGGVFNNANFFDSSERRAVECATTIYSFGSKVLEAREVKHAVLVDNSFVYQFEFVNQFFNAFLKGVKSLSNWQEVALAMANLSVVQVFTDLEDLQQQQQQQPPFTPTTDGMKRGCAGGPSPLLVMAYDFELGAGDVVARYISDGSEILESLVC